MAMNRIPVKTEVGADELRGRSRTLGQRHRTVLLLVDGRRTLSDVLSLAQQAGAQPSLFDELVQMGMVKMPEAGAEREGRISERGASSSGFARSAQSRWPSVSPAAHAGTPNASLSASTLWQDGPAAPAPAPEVRAAQPRPPDKAPYEIGEIVPSRHPADAARALPVPAPRSVPVLTELRSAGVPAESSHTLAAAPPPRVTPAAVLPAALPTARAKPLATDRPAAPPRAEARPRPVVTPAPTRAQAVVKAALRVDRDAAGSAVPSLSLRDELQGVTESPVVNVRRTPGETETDKLEHVRTLLFDTLRIDSPIFGARMLLRLREATSRDDLIELVWAIERHLAETRHSRREMLSLHRARELLGLGNTVVPDE